MVCGTLVRGRKPGATCGLEAARRPGPGLELRWGLVLRRRLGLRRRLKLQRRQAFRRGTSGPGVPGRAGFAWRLVSIRGVTHERRPAPPLQAPPASGR